MWQRPANTIPQLTRKGYQPHGFVWGALFLIPQLVGSACGIIRGVVWCIWQNCIGTACVFMLLIDTPCLGLKQHYNWYGAIVLPIGL